MTAMPPLRSILNDTPANAIDVDWNFQTVEEYVATEVIKRDGTVAMAAPLNLLGAAPSIASHAVPKSYVDAILPIGAIFPFAGIALPASGGWAVCDGSQQSTTHPSYAALFAVIQYSYGGSGALFNLPDLRARVPVGRALTDPLFGNLGQVGGQRDATSVPAHTHNMKNHTHALKNHVHDMQAHTHRTTFADGHDVASANFAGNTDAVFVPGSVPLSFAWKPTAILAGDVPTAGYLTTGPETPNTGAPTDNTSNVPNDNTTDGPNVAPITNANIPPYITLNYIIRIG